MMGWGKKRFCGAFKITARYHRIAFWIRDTLTADVSKWIKNKRARG
jgi:hypothetical protein